MQVVAKVLSGFFLLTLSVLAQPQNSSPPKATGTIAGRITIGAKAVAGVDVMLKPNHSSPVADVLQIGPVPSATTDADGAYKLVSVASGSYRVIVYAPAYIVEDEDNSSTPGKIVNVDEGEVIENVDFELTRGGVLTGKVTDPDGHPVIGEAVQAILLDDDGKPLTSDVPSLNLKGWETDDRGVYRIYGLEAGRYRIAAGPSSDMGAAMMKMAMGGGGENAYHRTFYPDTLEEAKAKIVEVDEGKELENLDIKMAVLDKNKTFTVAGRVIEAASGKPVANVMVTYTGTKPEAPKLGLSMVATNADGDFKFTGLKPDSYQTIVVSIGANENYAEPFSFEVLSSDLSGLEIKMHRGAKISGVAVLEGATDPALREKLTKIILMAMSRGGDDKDGPGMANGQIAPNGTFQIAGVRPGKVQLNANTMMADKGFSLMRIEFNGAEVKDLPVNAGDNLTGVRLVFVYGSASILGKVEIRGALPADVKLFVSAQRAGAASDDFLNSVYADVDARGAFVLEGLAAGTYRLRLINRNFGNDGSMFMPEVEQSVVVSGKGQQTVRLVLDVKKEAK